MAAPTPLKMSKVLFQLENNSSWFENISIRANGTILSTRLDVPEVWLIDPATGKGSSILTVPEPIKSLSGITELTPDLFAVGAGRYDLAKGSVPGTWGVWTFDLASGVEAAQSTLKHVAATPNAALLNGLTTWNGHTVLAADSTHGVVYKVDVATGEVTTPLSGVEFEPASDGFVPLGVNGLKLHPDGQHLYFTNTTRASFCRVPVDSGSACATGPVEVVAAGFIQDDFAFGPDGAAYVTTNPANIVLRVDIELKTFAEVAGRGDSLELAGGTACAFGRGAPGEAKKLYVVTSGGLVAPVNGETEPAKVAVIELD